MTRRGVIGVVAGAVVVTAALLLTASSRPVELLARPATTETFPPPLPTLTSLPPTRTPTPTASSTGDGGFDPSALFGAVLALLIISVVLGLVVLLVTVLRSVLRAPHVSVHEEPSFAVPPVPDELLHSAADRLARLATGEPRNAIVAAWLDLETSAATTGLPRDPAETSSEYTARVLGTWDVDRERLADLAALFREARFSTHPLGEEHRQRAVDDLTALHRDLERVAAAQRRTTDDGVRP